MADDQGIGLPRAHCAPELLGGLCSMDAERKESATERLNLKAKGKRNGSLPLS